MPATTVAPKDRSPEEQEPGKEAEAEAEAHKVESLEERQEEADPATDDPTFMSPRDPDLRTAELNSAPHPELWPAPDTDADAKKPEGSKTGIRVVPAEPSVNFEYVIKAHGLPVNSGLTVKITQTDMADTWLTHKSDPFGDAHIVWRTPIAGEVSVEFFGRDAGETAKSLASHTFEIVAPARDRRFGEARGHA